MSTTLMVALDMVDVEKAKDIVLKEIFEVYK